MSTLDRGRASRRLRTGGMALIGVAIISALIGLILAVHRGGQTPPPGPSAASPAHPSPGAPPSVIPFPPPADLGPTEAPVVSPPVVQDTTEAPQAGQMAVSRGEVRVYNNSTLRGLAARAARDLSAAGWTVVEVGNFARGTVATTTVYYQEGTDQRAEAEEIATQFRMRVEPRFSGIAGLPTGVIVIVTNDYAH